MATAWLKRMTTGLLGKDGPITPYRTNLVHNGFVVSMVFVLLHSLVDLSCSNAVKLSNSFLTHLAAASASRESVRVVRKKLWRVLWQNFHDLIDTI